MKLCKCGCGGKVKNKYIRGHNRKKCTLTENHKKKIGESNKGNIPWNKNKTEIYSEQILRKMSEAKKDKPLTEEHKKRISESNRGKNKHTIKKIQKIYPFFSKIEEMRYNPDKPGEIQVHCKNHNCANSKEKNGWFTPNRDQFFNRVYMLENNDSYDGLYFYCSKQCKQNCPLYYSHGNLDKEKLYTLTEYKVWRKEVLKRDNFKCVGYDGHYCGKKAKHAHHIYPVKTHPDLALDPDNGISLCEECHKYIHRKGTQCSNGELANKIC